MNMLKLYHWEPNGTFLKPLIALEEKGLEFDSHYTDILAFEQYGNAFPKAETETILNMEGEGPLLIHDGRQITESYFMMEYLEEAFPGSPLPPADAAGHWRARAWARFISEVFMPAASTLGCSKFLVPALQARGITTLPAALDNSPMTARRDAWLAAIGNDYSGELLADSRRKAGIGIERIEKALADSDWLLGDAFSITDIDAFAIANSLPLLVPDLLNADAAPRTMDWLGRLRARPSVQAALGRTRTGKPEEAFAPGPEHSRWG
jgi:GST-like protein